MVKGIIYNLNVEDLAKEPEVTIVPGVTIGEHDREYFYREVQPAEAVRGRQESQINQDKFRKYKIFVK